MRLSILSFEELVEKTEQEQYFDPIQDDSDNIVINAKINDINAVTESINNSLDVAESFIDANDIIKTADELPDASLFVVQTSLEALSGFIGYPKVSMGIEMHKEPRMALESSIKTHIENILDAILEAFSRFIGWLKEVFSKLNMRGLKQKMSINKAVSRLKKVKDNERNNSIRNVSDELKLIEDEQVKEVYKVTREFTSIPMSKSLAAHLSVFTGVEIKDGIIDLDPSMIETMVDRITTEVKKRFISESFISDLYPTITSNKTSIAEYGGFNVTAYKDNRDVIIFENNYRSEVAEELIKLDNYESIHVTIPNTQDLLKTTEKIAQDTDETMAVYIGIEKMIKTMENKVRSIKKQTLPMNELKEKKVIAQSAITFYSKIVMGLMQLLGEIISFFTTYVNRLVGIKEDSVEWIIRQKESNNKKEKESK